MNLPCRRCGRVNRVPLSRVRETARCGACKEPLPAPTEPVEVTTEREFDEALRAKVPVIVDFWAPWCGPCRTIAPELEKIARARSGSLMVVKLNTEQVPAIAQRFGIQSIPTITLFVDGKPASTVTGARPAQAILTGLGL